MNPENLQWTALIFCAVAAALRVPGLAKGRGRSIFAALVLMTAAVGLSLSPIYLVVDGFLGGVNVANLVLRLILFAVFLLLGIRMAAAFGSSVARRLIVGPFGLAVLALCVIATLYFFVASELPVSSRGLSAFQDQDTVLQYLTVGRFYPGYVSACLLPAALVSVLDKRARTLHRVAGAFLAGGFFLVVLFVVLRFVTVPLYPWDVILSFAAILLTAVGLCLIWLSRTLGSRKQQQRNLLA
jgi:hypothetical protein